MHRREASRVFHLDLLSFLRMGADYKERLQQAVCSRCANGKGPDAEERREPEELKLPYCFSHLLASLALGWVPREPAGLGSWTNRIKWRGRLEICVIHWRWRQGQGWGWGCPKWSATDLGMRLGERIWRREGCEDLPLLYLLPWLGQVVDS